MNVIRRLVRGATALAVGAICVFQPSVSKAEPTVVIQGDHGEATRDVAILSERALLASAHFDGIRLWQLTDGTLLRQFRDVDAHWFDAVALSSEGLLAATAWRTAGDDYMPVLVIWDVSDGSVRMRVDLPDVDRPYGHLTFHDHSLRIERLDRVLAVDVASGRVETIGVRRPPPITGSPGARRLDPAEGRARLPIARGAPFVLLGLASGGAPVSLWSTETGRVMAAFPGVVDELPLPAAVTADGRRAMVMLSERRVVLWDTQTATLTRMDPPLVAALPIQSDAIRAQHLNTAGAFSPRGDVAFFLDSMPASIGMIDSASGRFLARLESPSGEVMNTLFAPDDEHVVASNWTGTIQVWHWPTRRLVRTIAGRVPSGLSEVSGDVSRLLTVSRRSGRAELWDLERLALVRDFPTPLFQFPENADFAATADARHLVRWGIWNSWPPAPSGFRRLTIWDAEAGIQVPSDHIESLRRLLVTDPGRWVVTYACSNPWATSLVRAEYPTLTHISLTAGTCILTPDGRHSIEALTVDEHDRASSLRISDEGRAVRTIPAPNATYPEFTHDGRSLVLHDWRADREMLFEMWGDAPPRSLQAARLTRLAIARTPSGSMIWSDGHFLGCPYERCQLGVYDVRTGDRVLDLDVAGSVIAADTDGRRLLVRSDGPYQVLVDTQSGDHIARLEARLPGIPGVAKFLEDRCRIATQGWPGGLTLWNAETGAPVVYLSIADEPAGAILPARTPEWVQPSLIAILPSGHYAATPGGEARLRVTEGSPRIRSTPIANASTGPTW